MSGWFAMKHGITDHPIFKGRPERLGAWVVMLDKAAFADVEIDVGGRDVLVKRGELCASQAMLERWTGLPRQQLRTFLNRLESAGTIKTRPAHELTKGRTILTICNYNKYQTPQPSANQALTKRQPTKEQDNNIPVGTADKSASSGVVDLSSPEAAVWAIGKAYLGKHGVSNPGALIGKFLKSGSAVDVLAAISSAERAKTQDPVPYITEAIKPKKVRFQDMSPREQAMALL